MSLNIYRAPRRHTVKADKRLRMGTVATRHQDEEYRVPMLPVVAVNHKPPVSAEYCRVGLILQLEMF